MKAEEGIGSLKIAAHHRELEKKRLAVLYHHSTGRSSYVLLSHSLLVFQSGGRRDTVPLRAALQGAAYTSGLAGRLPACHRLTVFTHSSRARLCVSPEATRSESRQQWAPTRGPSRDGG